MKLLIAWPTLTTTGTWHPSTSRGTSKTIWSTPAQQPESLDHTNVTDRGVKVLRSMATLQSLDLYHTTISKYGYEALRTSLPQCRILYEEQSGFPTRRGIQS